MPLTRQTQQKRRPPANAQDHANSQAEPHKKGQHAAKQAASANETAPVAAQANPPNAPADQTKPRAQSRRQREKAGRSGDQSSARQISAPSQNRAKVPAVTFNQSYRIRGSDHWQGPKYEVFRSYRPERHDRALVPFALHPHRADRRRLLLLENGYWFPAWGYSPSAQYYAYDGPIYVGHRAVPPDQVIADVQAGSRKWATTRVRWMDCSGR